MKKLITLLVVLSLTLFTACSSLSLRGNSPSDSAIQLFSEHGSCSGTQIEAPSGEKYILTASHCEPLIQDGVIMARVDGHAAIPRRVIQISDTTDLMLLEPMPGIPALPIAKQEPKIGDELWAYTHGRAFRTYESTGKYIDFKKVTILAFPISSDEDMEKCTSKPKYKVVEVSVMGIFTMQACAMNIDAYISLMYGIAPGSSGGMVLNSKDELTAVAFAGDNTFAMFVSLKDIRAFLSSY